jgi:hypothetical protein
MPKIKNLAALVAAVEGARRYARNNPDKAAKYLDQAASFLDKQTKGKYSGQIRNVAGKVKGAAGVSDSPRPGGVGNGVVQSFEANTGTGRHQSSRPTPTPANPGSTASAAPSSMPSSGTTASPTPSSTSAPTSPSATSAIPPVSTPKPKVTEPGEPHFPGSKDT